MAATFTNRVLKWFDQHGRHDLPWQKNPTPYRVWVSEIMLQQTQVGTVIPYFQKFMHTFKSLKSLAEADQDSVLSHWSGLGYYARARNLHKAAKIIQQNHGGRFPTNLEDITAHPGIGKSTAGAILSLAMQQYAVILDGNVKRVLTRFYALEGWPGLKPVEHQLWQLATALTPTKRVNDYNQAMMDLGATLCTRSKPQCEACPIKKDCKAFELQSQHLYPSRKPKTTRPCKTTYALIVINENEEILLQKRPPSGIWGGLWSLPECSDKLQIDAYLFESLQIEATQKTFEKSLLHQFSHFQLEIKPVLIKTHDTAQTLMESNQYVWYKQGQAPPGGMPAPMSKLMELINVT